MEDKDIIKKIEQGFEMMKNRKVEFVKEMAIFPISWYKLYSKEVWKKQYRPDCDIIFTNLDTSISYKLQKDGGIRKCSKKSKKR